MQLAIYLTRAPKLWIPGAKVPFRRHPVTRELIYGGKFFNLDTQEGIDEANVALKQVFANPKADMSLGPAVKIVANDYGAPVEIPVAVASPEPEGEPDPEPVIEEPLPPVPEELEDAVEDETVIPDAPVVADVISPVEVEDEDASEPTNPSPNSEEPRQKRKYTRRL